MQVSNINKQQTSFKAGVNIKTRNSGLYNFLRTYASGLKEYPIGYRVVNKSDLSRFIPDTFVMNPDKNGFHKGYLCNGDDVDIIKAIEDSMQFHLRKIQRSEEECDKSSFNYWIDAYNARLDYRNERIAEDRAKFETVIVGSIEDIRAIKGFENFGKPESISE